MSQQIALSGQGRCQNEQKNVSTKKQPGKADAVIKKQNEQADVRTEKKFKRKNIRKDSQIEQADVRADRQNEHTIQMLNKLS